MPGPVDLKNLHEMTGNDAGMEKELFAELISSFDEGSNSLATAVSGSDNESWRKNAHALKGIALNLGANHLGELCKKAQENSNADSRLKEIMLTDIKKEYEEVKKFLSG